MKYGAILIDPPWAFRTFSEETGTTPHRGAQDHYKTMPLYQIAGLPIPDLAAKNCALFMWIVDSHMDVAFTLLDVWEFKFKTRVFTWDKETIGMGYWSRKQTELCLLATKGAPRRKDKGVREKITEKRREHSRKPDAIYGSIERLVDGPYLEMFARQQWPGWDSWGNETTKFKPEVDPFT